MTIEELAAKHNDIFTQLGDRGPIFANLMANIAKYIVVHRITDPEVRLIANMLVECSTMADAPSVKPVDPDIETASW